ncbi:hypothetical protein [Paraburkholderia xenovorans]|uniref:hypothetical protein n=1 Tax=Paraburkholderia xenovorans TaxID=36873 RepID=UPI0038BB259F
METATIVLKISAGNAAEATELTSELQQRLTQEVENIRIDRKKESQDTLDPGTILVAVLGTQFAVELAKTLHAWLMRNNSAVVSIGSDGNIDCRGLTVEQVRELVRGALANTPKKG